MSLRAGRVFWKSQDAVSEAGQPCGAANDVMQAFLTPLLGSTVWFVFRFSRFDGKITGSAAHGNNDVGRL